MLDDEHDELPLVSVGSGSFNLSNFSMPPADVLASQRAREQECERELRLLREHKCLSEEVQSTPGNRSEIEELGLVEAEHVAPTRVSVDMSDLISRLLTHLREGDSQFLKEYLDVLRQDSPPVIEAVNNEMLRAIEAGLAGASGWLQGEAVCCVAWLCILCLGGGGQRERRTLHALLYRASAHQVNYTVHQQSLNTTSDISSLPLVPYTHLAVSEMSHAVCSAVRAPRLLLRLSDSLRSPGTPARLADNLVHYALAQYVSESSEKGEWRSLTHVQLAGRDAAAGRPPPQLATPRSRHHADDLKMAVAACRLDHLCRNNNNSSGSSVTD